MAAVGDLVKITTKSAKEQGILMPSTDPQVIIIKLENGYNLGYPKKGSKIELISKEPKPKLSQASKPYVKNNLPLISILPTRGTIPSKLYFPSWV